MSDRNNSDYYNFHNFDDSIDSRDYRRRQPDRRNNYSNGRPPYNKRRPSKRRMKTRTRNRIIIVSTAVVALVLVIVLLALIISSCSKGKSIGDPTNTDTKPTEQASGEASGNDNGTNTNVDKNKLAIDSFIPANPTDNNTTGYLANAIYVWNNHGFELFGGTADSVLGYSDLVNDLSGRLPDMDVYSMIIPNHTEMGLPARLKDSGEAPTNSQADTIKSAYSAMDKNKVTPVNCYNYLSEHCNEYIYFNSDHHWTGLGSYYAYTAFADAQGLPRLSLSDCEDATIEGFTGTLNQNAPGLEEDTVHYWRFPYSVEMDITDSSGNTQSYDSPYFENEEGGTLSYGVFIYGDNPLTVMRSSSENARSGKKIAVIKESYGNAFVPYLTYNYEEVHVCDLRSFREASSDDFATYCRKNGITDVLFLNGVMSTNNGDHLDSMENMFN